MKTSTLIGFVAGGMIGAVATMVSMPESKPKMRRAVKKGRRMIGSMLWR